jgi:endonuclease/exonuclease/phosphatase family metal-dependent hydrolase
MKVKNKLPFIDKLILWINFLLCLALLISYLAPVVDPRKVWILPFFGLAYPTLLISNLVIAVYWLLRRRWFALLSIVCIAFGWNLLLTNIGFHFEKQGSYISGPNVVHIMTYNVHNFKRYGFENDTSTKNEILRLIANEKPDVIGLQEFYTRKRGRYDMRDSLLKIMGTRYYYFEPVTFNDEVAIGIAIFSRFPIISHGIVPFYDQASENSCIYIDVIKDNRKLRVYSVHLQSVRFDPEDYKYFNSVSHDGEDGDDEPSSARRLGSKLKSAFKKRSEQVFKIKEHAKHCPYPYIICGDFNDTPASFAVNEMAKGLKNAFREKGFGLGHTYNGDFPNYQIDYIMATPQFDILNYHIIERKLSDHYPVRSDLLLR